MQYGLHLAKIKGWPEEEYDDRLFVQIVPEMEDISDNLPCWPHFFKEKHYKGQVDDLVWVVCDEEYSVGYILGHANYFAYPEDTTSFISESITETLKTTVSQILSDIEMSSLSFYNIEVTFWNDNCIHMVERSTGGFILAYDSGSIFIMRPDQFMVKIGDNIFRISSTSVAFNALKIQLQSDEVRLGNNPDNSVVVTSGTGEGMASTSDSVYA